jgi:ubiquinone/menaquinone biosynthesis C-methylase UbiE
MTKLTKAFNNAAADYDVTFTHSAIGQLQRNRVWNYLEQILKNRKAELLEINCGTGEDALWLSNKCYSVLGTDTAGGMVAVAESKRLIQNKKNVTFRTLNFFQLKTALEPQQFDFILSNFGGLNCINELEMEHLSNHFSSLLYPGGKMVIVVMGKYCLWETAYFLFKLKLGKALRRWDNKAVDTMIGEDEFETWFYSVNDLKKIFEKNFKLIDTKPIAFAVPPSYLENYFTKKPKLLKWLNQVDNVFTKWNFLSNFSDHLILTFEVNNPIKTNTNEQ